VFLLAATLWLISRKPKGSASKGDKEGQQIEIARLNERNTSLIDEVGKCRAKISEWEAKDQDWQKEISIARDDRSRFEERASRVAPLEVELSQTKRLVDSLQEKNITAETQLAERTQSLDYAQKQRLPELESLLSQARTEVSTLRENLARITSTCDQTKAVVEALTAELSEVKPKYERLREDNEHIKTEFAQVTTTLNNERDKNTEKLALLTEAKEQLTNQFKSLANDILEEKSKRFTEQNKQNLGQILDPLKDKLKSFQEKVEQVYIQEGKDRTALSEQVKQLLALNQQLSADAGNLTQALKGSSKAQGTWGELVLERILETSGLRKGHEYDTKESHVREDGTRAQPDVVIHLPEDKHLVVDAKVSLTAYEDYAKGQDDASRNSATARHLTSVRAHVKDLSGKNYQQLYGLKSLDFVIMFIPIESAFILAINEDSKLWEDAWKRNVILISPSALLFVLRTVAHLWRQEQQNQNVQDIAKRGAELCDKLAGFLEDLDGLGSRMNQARESYDNAMNKFTRGRGNLIWQAQRLKDLGVKPSKPLPHALIESASPEDLEILPDSSESTLG